MKNFLRLFDFLFLCCLSVFIASCSTSLESTAYLSSDNGDGTYTNPVIQADYPDPDIIRVGEDYYMVSSSFVAMPGIPVCHSKDLVNWEIIGHAVSHFVRNTVWKAGKRRIVVFVGHRR